MWRFFIKVCEIEQKTTISSKGWQNGLPQNTQNSQNLSLSILPQISDAILGGALVSARLCRLPEQEVHQHNKIYILPQNSEHILAGIFSHRFHSKFAEECDAVA